MTFSAVIPCFNDAARLTGALASLAAQTVRFDEIVVVDDASTDGSLPLVAARVAATPGARLVRNPRNLGVVGALNAGLREATGDHVFLGSSNDTYAAGLVEHARDALAARPAAALVCGNSVVRDGAGRRREVVISLPQRWGFVGPEEVLASARERILGFAPGASFIARTALQGAGGLQPALRWNSDWFVYCLLALTRGACVVPEVVSTLDASPGSYSQGVFRWEGQGPVTRAFLQLLLGRHRAELPRFREAAVLPRHTRRELALIVGQRELWPYLTPLLARRCLEDDVFAPARRVQRLVRRLAG